MPSLSDPVALSAFGLSIRWYAVFILLGVAIALIVLRHLAAYRGLDPEFPLDAAPWVILSALIGARLYYLLLQWDFYIDHPRDALNIRLGGLTVHGAVAGGLLGLYVYSRYRNQRFLTWADLTAAVLPIGQAFGRWGNWANQEAFGTPTSLPWAVTIEPARRPAEYAEFSEFHPAFLYEAILNLVIAIGLIALVRRMPSNRFWREGDVVWLYLIFYGAIRLAIESIRTDSLNIGPWPAAYWISVGMMIAGGLMLVSRRTIWPGERVADIESSQPTQSDEPVPVHP